MSSLPLAVTARSLGARVDNIPTFSDTKTKTPKISTSGIQDFITWIQIISDSSSQDIYLTLNHPNYLKVTSDNTQITKHTVFSFIPIFVLKNWQLKTCSAYVISNHLTVSKTLAIFCTLDCIQPPSLLFKMEGAAGCTQVTLLQVWLLT